MSQARQHYQKLRQVFSPVLPKHRMREKERERERERGRDPQAATLTSTIQGNRETPPPSQRPQRNILPKVKVNPEIPKTPSRVRNYVMGAVDFVPNKGINGINAITMVFVIVALQL